MRTFRSIALLTASPLIVLLALMPGCEEKPAPSTPSQTTNASKDAYDHGHDHAHDGDHAHDDDHKDDHGHGETTELGERTAGEFTIKASRDGDVTPGGDVPIDVWVSGDASALAAVRFWIGTEDAKGSIKAKAELERDNWHTHAEVPDTLPEGCMLWVEIEANSGTKSSVGFDLKL